MKNLKINRKEGKAELDLNPVFYPKNIVEKTVKDFKKVFDADFENNDDRITLKLKLKAKEVKIEEAVNDLINYLLAEVKNSEVSV